MMAPLEPEHAPEPTKPPPLRPLPPRSSKRRWPWFALGGLLLFAALVAAVMTLMPSKVEVPSVVGASVSSASQRLRSDGFKVEILRDNSDKPRNTVVGQDPLGETIADEGSTVTLNISDGPPLQAVPDVVGDGRRAARRTLSDAGFKVEERTVPSATVKLNRVVSQTPSAKSQYERGATVELVISGGPEQLQVPDVIGKTENEARSALEGAGFRVTVAKQEVDKKEPGTVLSQNPAAGAASRGSLVTISVAEEPKQVSVPGVVGRSQNAATETLSDAGLKIDVEETPVDTPDKDGIVQAQTPDPDEKVDRGTTVTITVGVFDPDLNPDPPAATTTPTTTTPAAAPPVAPGR
ncbi:MAG: PASTA domain-containing protein [Solirubrobacterales bacterium]|nr:PASTA domain-containing protein [Solirubrobacterales bacterium]